MPDSKADCPGTPISHKKTCPQLARFLFLATARRRFEREELLVERLDTVHVEIRALTLPEAQSQALKRLNRCAPESRWNLALALAAL